LEAAANDLSTARAEKAQPPNGQTQKGARASTRAGRGPGADHRFEAQTQTQTRTWAGHGACLSLWAGAAGAATTTN